MTQATSRPGAGDAGETARRMRALTAELSAAGLEAYLHDTRGVLDITATAHRPGHKPAEVIVDDDGYVQISYWAPPGATPTRVAAVIARALTMITKLS